MCTFIINKTKLSSFLAALFCKAGEDIAFLSGSCEREKVKKVQAGTLAKMSTKSSALEMTKEKTEEITEEITLKSETEGYFIVYPKVLSYEIAKEKRAKLFILDLEEDLSQSLLDILDGQNGIVLCIYQNFEDKKKKEAMLARYKDLQNHSLKEKSTLLAQINAKLEAKEENFIIHTENKICEVDFDEIYRTHVFDVEMIEDLLSDVGLWCERRGKTLEEDKNWVF